MTERISPLSALFEGGLLHHSSLEDLRAHLKSVALPDRVEWTDPSGTAWSLVDRLAWLVVHRGTTPEAAQLLPELMVRDFAEGRAFSASLKANRPAPWHAAGAAEKERRALLWLALEILPSGRRHRDHASAWMNLALRRTFSKQPVGTPASGFGDASDAGWLAWGLRAAERALENAPASATWWSDLGAGWWSSNLMLEQQDSQTGSSWWRQGGINGKLKDRHYLGDPGLESEKDLPGTVRYSGFQQALRPSTLPLHWEALAVRLANFTAQAMRKAPSPDVRKRWSAAEELAAEENKAWLTPPVQAALAQVAWAGLVAQPVSEYAHRQWDGRAKAALTALVAVAPDGDWLPPEGKRALAQAVLEHQAALEADPRPHAHALAFTDLAWLASPVYGWAQAQATPAAPGPRLLRPL